MVLIMKFKKLRKQLRDDQLLMVLDNERLGITTVVDYVCNFGHEYDNYLIDEIVSGVKYNSSDMTVRSMIIVDIV